MAKELRHRRSERNSQAFSTLQLTRLSTAKYPVLRTLLQKKKEKQNEEPIKNQTPTAENVSGDFQLLKL